MATTIATRRRINNRQPQSILELDRQVQQLQQYLYNFWLRKIKKLAFTESLPIEFFRKKYEDELEVNLRKFIEQIYITRIKSLEKKLIRIEQKRKRELTRSKSASISDVFTSILDIENIKKTVTAVKDRFFNSASRLISRASTSRFNPFSNKVEIPAKFDEQAAFKRVGSFGAYSAYNDATQSKLGQIDDTQKVIYITARDERVCNICNPFDGEVYEVLSADAPYLPQHEFCRCFYEPVI